MSISASYRLRATTASALLLVAIIGLGCSSRSGQKVEQQQAPPTGPSIGAAGSAGTPNGAGNPIGAGPPAGNTEVPIVPAVPVDGGDSPELNADGTPKTPGDGTAVVPKTNPDGTPIDPNAAVTPATNPDGTPVTPAANPDGTPVTPATNPDGTPVTPVTPPQVVGDGTPVLNPDGSTKTNPDGTPVTGATNPDGTPITPGNPGGVTGVINNGGQSPLGNLAQKLLAMAGGPSAGGGVGGIVINLLSTAKQSIGNGQIGQQGLGTQQQGLGSQQQGLGQQGLGQTITNTNTNTNTNTSVTQPGTNAGVVP